MSPAVRSSMAPSTNCSSWHISNIQIKAFKSFSRAASFTVDSNGLIGIVGPNGSGKSNLLEGVCFATGCSTGVLRGCHTLRDVCSTDVTTQLPEVKLRFSCGKSHHLLETTLTPEGTRQYRIDGRLRSGTQVKEFLRNLRITVDSTTVIQQAAITRLTNSNSPCTLAGLVAAASGLDSWNQEASAAHQEVVRTRRALRDIQANISKVQAAAAADQDAIQIGCTAARLEAELEATLEQLVSMLLQQQAGFSKQLLGAQQQEHNLEVSKTAAAEQVKQLTAVKQQLTTQQAQVLADLDVYKSGGGSSSLVGDIAAAEAKVTSLQAEAAARAAQTAERLSCKHLLQQQQTRVQHLQSMLQMKQDAAEQAVSALAAMQGASGAADSAKQQLKVTQKQVASAGAALAQQQSTVDARAGQLQQAKAGLAAVQLQLQTISSQVLAATPASALPRRVAVAAAQAADDHGLSSVTAAAAAARTAAAAADNQLQHIGVLQQQVLQLQIDHEACGASLTPHTTAALLSICSHSSSSGCRARPLYQCFTLRTAAKSQHLSPLLVPLAVIAGPSVLQVLVTHSVCDANKLLAAAAATSGQGRGGDRSSRGKLRIWPLDNLKANSFLQRQRAAQQTLGANKVILPLDLMEYHSTYEPAMIRAFGGLVIAADDTTAAELVQLYGLSSVTLQGTVSVKGSMSGGWSGNSTSHSQGYWANKLKQDLVAGQLQEAQQQLMNAMSMQQELETGRKQAEANLAAVEQRQQLQQERQRLQADLVAAEGLLQQEQQCLSALQQRNATLQLRLQQCTAMVKNTESTQGDGHSSTAARAALKQQLEEHARVAAADVKGALQQLLTAEDEVEELAARLETLELQLSSGPDTEQAQLLLQQHTSELHKLRQQQAEQQHAVQQLSDQHMQLQQQLKDAQQQLQQQQTQLRALIQRRQRAAAEVATAEACLQKSMRDLRQLSKEFTQHDALHGVLNGTPSATPSTFVAALAATPGERGPATGQVVDAGNTAASAVPQELKLPSVKEVQQLTRQSKRLQQELQQLEVPHLPAAQKELCESRMSQVLLFRQQAQALEAAAAALEHYITAWADQVYAANDAVYEDIAAGFTQLCSSLLPCLQLQLHRTAELLAHQGLQFRFRRLEGNASAACQTADMSPSAAAAGASSCSSQGWHTSLSQLSGGQQTMVSLAMLLAVARSGNGSKLFLLDEVDAALDQHNQARAVALLKQLAAGANDGCGCQILCVTHNAAFQQGCDAFVKVVRAANGSSMPAAAAAAGDQGVSAVSSRADVAGKGQAVGNSRTACTLAKATGKPAGRHGRALRKKVRFA